MALNPSNKEQRLTREIISASLDGACERIISEILETDATPAEFQDAVVRASAGRKIEDGTQQPLTGKAATVYKILMQEGEK